jgi:3-methyladenine DNA glycosylase AlkD
MRSPAPGRLARAIRTALARHGDPGRAVAMRAYMKSALPFHGVSTPLLRRICREGFAAHRLATTAEWRAAIAALWEGATHREERHAAIELAGARRYRPFETPAALPLYRRLIRSGAWWDYVDALAQRVSSLLARYPDRLSPVLRTWARDPDLWTRRVAIISQVTFRQHTDSRLLRDVLAPSLDSREFFLRKAIGWALREYAKADPAAVRRYLARHRDRLSALSRREAEKGLAYVERHGILHRARRPE